MSKTSQLAKAEGGLIAPWGKNNTALTANRALTGDELGLVQINASAGAVTITLPGGVTVCASRIESGAQ